MVQGGNSCWVEDGLSPGTADLPDMAVHGAGGGEDRDGLLEEYYT